MKNNAKLNKFIDNKLLSSNEWSSNFGFETSFILNWKEDPLLKLVDTEFPISSVAILRIPLFNPTYGILMLIGAQL